MGRWLWLAACVFVGLLASELHAEGAAGVSPGAAGAAPVAAEPWLSRGVWTDTVPLDLPPGPGGLGPGVALVADPGVREGLLGFGWTLGGLSRIERRSLTGGVPTVFDGSSYRLDGQELHLNADTGCYEPEQLDGRCVGYDAFSNTWSVRHEGTTWTYGALEEGGAAVGLFAAEVPPSSADETALWLLASVEDRFGHRVVWEYSSELLYDAPLPGAALAWAAQSHPVPVRVSWGAAELVLDYEDRGDWRLDAGSGGMLVWDRRLSGLEARVNGGFYSAYTVAYAGSERQSVVQSVSRVGADGGVKALRTLALVDEEEGWEPEGEDVSAQLPYPFTTLLADWPGYALADEVWNRWSAVNLNGDGRPDLILVSTACYTFDSSVDPLDNGFSEVPVEDFGLVQSCGSRARAWVNQPSAAVSPGTANGSAPMFVEDAAWSSRLSAIFGDVAPQGWALADIDRDGWTDLVYETPGSGGVVLLRFEPWSRSFTTTALPIDAEHLRRGQLADLDGDGLPDLLVPATEGEGSLWLRNAGVEGGWYDGPTEDLSLPLDDEVLEESPPEGWPDSCAGVPAPTFSAEDWDSAQDYRSAQARWADFNGDGVLDVAYALYTCWEDLHWSVGGEVPLEGSEFSRLFYGDGRGGFTDSGLGAGEPWMIAVEPGGTSAYNHHANNHMQVVDVDRSGSLALLQYAGEDAEGQSVVLGGYDRGLLQGYFPAWSGWPADFDPGVSVLGGKYPHESQVLFADFDGDGFPDQLRLRADREDDKDLQEVPTWTATWHRNTRTGTQGRVGLVQGPWGGVTDLRWGFTANRSGNNGGVEEGVWALEDEDAPNRYLHTNQEVLVAAEGAEGAVQYRYLHGFHDGERFRGFGVVERSDPYGRVEYGFGVSPALSGAGLYVARYRADDTLSSFVLYLHLTNGLLCSTLPDTDSWGLDIAAPYFNPMTRQCVFEVGASGADPLELVSQCLFYDRVSAETPDPAEWLAAAGFAVVGELAERVWEGDPSGDTDAVEFGVWGGESEALGFTARGSEADSDGRATEVPSGWSLPERPEAPEPGADESQVLHLTSWSYFENGQLAWVGQHRDASTDADDLETRYTWSDRDEAAWGYTLLSTVTTDRSGAQLERLTRSDFVAGAFDLPQTVTRCGRSSAACVTLAQSWADSSGALPGAVTALVYPDGSAEAFEYDPDCGGQTRHTDRVGRVTKTRYDALCRREQVLAQGARSTWAYDGFNRVCTERSDPDATDGLEHDAVTTWSVYEEELGAMPISGLNLGAHKAQVSSAGRVDWLSVDGWGREVYTASCPGERAGAEVLCTGDVRVSGQVRLSSGRVGWTVLPHFDGGERAELVAFTQDEQGRVVARSAPSSAEDGARAETTTLYAPGRVVVTSPLGVEEETLYDTLGWETWRAGLFRGAVERDAWGLTLRETDAAGVVYAYEYDEQHRLSREELTYDAGLAPSSEDGCVAATATSPDEDPCTRAWTHSYDVFTRTHSVTDPEGVVTVLTYDAADRLVQRSIAGSVVEKVKYKDGSSGGASATRTDEAGASVTQSFDGWGRVTRSEDLAGTATTVYAADGLARRTVDGNGRSLVLERDVWGEVAAVCTGAGWDEGAERCVSPLLEYTTDGAGRVVLATDADGVVTEAVRSATGQLLELWQGPYLLESRQYDVQGRVTQSTVEGVTETWTYDALDRPTEQVTGASDRWRVWTWNDGDQLVAETVGPVNGGEASTRYSYDAVGQLRAVVHPGSTAPTERMVYDALGRLRFHEDEVGAIARRDYDTRGRVSFQRVPGEGEVSLSYKVGLSWDGEDHLTRIRQRDGEGHTTELVVDALGRVQGEVLADDTTLRHVYEGHDAVGTLHTGVDGRLLAAQSRSYEAETGRPSAVYDWYVSESGVPSPADYAVRVEWTAAGRLASLDAAGERTEWVYDHGLLSIESWDNGVQSRSLARWGSDPRVMSETWTGSDGVNHRLRSFGYDGAGRLTSESITDTWSGQTLHTSWSGHDAYDGPAEITRSVDEQEVSAEVWSYDARGWPAARETWVEGVSVGTMSWSWYDDGALRTQTTPTGRTLRHVRALVGEHHLLERLEVDGATVAEVTRRDKNLRPTRLSLGGGRQTLGLGYDAMGRLDEKWASAGLGAPGIAWEAGYDERGRLVEERITDTDGAHVSTYSYTEPGWLTAETHERGGAWSAEYLHDGAGNRVERWSDGALEEELVWSGSVVAEVNGWEQVYDPFDGVEDDGERIYTHEPDGELSGIGSAEGLVSIVRDPWGRPVLTEDETGQTVSHFGVGHGGLPVETETPEGSVLELSVEGVRLGQLWEGSSRPVPLFTNPQGSVLQHGAEPLPAFGAFGDRLSGPSSGVERQLYAGLTSLPGAPEVLLAQHRAYHPGTGRFLSPDPIGLAGGLHRSRYANNNPVSFSDPTGWSPEPSRSAEPGVYEPQEPTGGDRGGGGEPKELATLCSVAPSACAGNQAGLDRERWAGRFVLHQEGGDAELDAGVAARSERRSRRQEARELRRGLREGRVEPDGQVEVVQVGDDPNQVEFHLSPGWRWQEPRSALERARSGLVRVGASVREQWEGFRARHKDAGEAAWKGAQAGFGYYLADSVETFSPGEGTRLRAVYDGALAGMGAPDAAASWRQWAGERYLEGHALDPDAALAGAVGSTIVIAAADVLAPGPTGEGKVFVKVGVKGRELAGVVVRKVDDVWEGATGAGKGVKASKAADNVPASTPVGRSGKGNQLDVAGTGPGRPPHNSPATIGDREYSGHALDRMQERGLVPSVIEDTISTGASKAGNSPGTSVFTTNQAEVVIDDATGRIITAGQR